MSNSNNPHTERQTSSSSGAGQPVWLELARISAVLCAGFLTLYFADSSTRLFVKHALVFDSLTFGGISLLLCFVSALCALIFLLSYLRGLWLGLAFVVVLSCIVAAETAFRVTGVPLNTFHVSLFIEAKTDGGNALGEYGAMMASIALWAAVVLVPGCLALRLIRWRPSGGLVVATSGLAVLLLSIGTLEFEGQIFVPSPLGLPLATARMYSEQQFRERDPVSLSLVGQNPVKHFVYIVDETIRSDHISINDPLHGVTPWLAAYPGVVSLGPSVSVSNCSVASQYMLRTGVTPEELPDLEKTTLQKPNIFAYAKKAGRSVRFIDAQSDIFTNYMSEHDLVGVDWELGVAAEIDACTRSGECKLISRLHSIAATDEPSFTHVVKDAAHWPYEIRYPATQAVFQPVPAAGQRSPEQIANSYKNAIRWNVDLFFKELLEEASFKDYLIIYTGDHGEDVTPPPGFSPHCGHDNKVRAIEGIVPILVFTDRPELKATFEQVAALRAGRTSQYDIFPSWLALMGYDRRQVLDSYGPSVFDARLRRMQFYWGDMFHNYGAFYQVSPG